MFFQRVCTVSERPAHGGRDRAAGRGGGGAAVIVLASASRAGATTSGARRGVLVSRAACWYFAGAIGGREGLRCRDIRYTIVVRARFWTLAAIHRKFRSTGGRIVVLLLGVPLLLL